jgi:Fibronectin type III domain
MPTISQLPVASQVTAADQLPISQGGTACSVSIGTLLAGTQPAILAVTGTLLGRTSLGPGGPDQVEVGVGLLLNSDSLVATGADHAGFPALSTLTLSDEVVLSSEGNPKLLQLPLLRGLFAPGPNISIDQYGTISATLAGGISAGAPKYSITSLPTVTTIASSDLVAISQSGSDHSITYANLIDGQTIDQAHTAAAAADTDTFLVAQSGNAMLCQTLAAVWVWLNSKIAGHLLPTLELTSNTTLNASIHNGHILVCSQPITVTAATTEMGSGFACNLLNVSAGNIIFGTGISTSSGTSSLPQGQAATLTCVTYSGGTLVYAWSSASASSLGTPGQVGGLTASSQSASSVTLIWTATLPPPASYTVQYRITGTAGWSTVLLTTTSGCTVAGLLSTTSYDFVVSAVNSVGAGIPSAIVSVTTSGSLSPPGQVTGLTTSNATTSGISLTWLTPGSGGSVSSYTVQYRVSATTSWSTGASGLTSTSFSITGLVAATSYNFEVLAVNAAGTGPASSVATASTVVGSSITSITWNTIPSGSYTRGISVIVINALVSPSSAPVQFGFSTSLTAPPTSWTIGSYVNASLWGAYVNTPSVPGTWYAWVEGTDGSTPTVYPTGFSVI